MNYPEDAMKNIIIALALVALLSVSGQAQIIFDPPLNLPIQFPDTEVGQRGNAELVVTVIQGWWAIQMAVDGREFSVNPGGVNLGERESAEFVLTFIPDEVGNRRGALTVLAISENGMGLATEVQLVGTGIEAGEPEIVIDPEEIFLEINDEQDSDFAELCIRNEGDAGLHVSIRFDDPGWFEFRGEALDVEIEPRDEFEFIIVTTEDIPEDGEYVTNLSITSDDPDNPRIFLPVHLTVDVGGVGVQVIGLERGWNLISANRFFSEDFVDDEGPDMQLILADIIEDIALIKNQHGEFCTPEFNFWGIDAWEMDKAYQVKTNAATELQVVGEPIPWDTEINLTAGWNLVAYYPDYETWGLQNGLAELIERDQLELAKDGEGRFLSPFWEFWGPDGIPGQGYQLKVTEDCSFHWAPEQDGMALDRPAVIPPNHFQEPRPTDLSMSIILQSVVGLEVVDGAEIALITPRNAIGGLAVLTGEPSWGITAWGDDGTTEEIEGFREGEPMRFLFWDSVHDWELEMELDADGELIYRTNGLLIINATVDVAPEISPMPSDLSLTDIYPNPFNSTTTIGYSLPMAGNVSLAVYDLSGREVARLAEGVKPAGTYEAVWTADGMSSGVYVVTLNAGGVSAREKVVLVR